MNSCTYAAHSFDHVWDIHCRFSLKPANAKPSVEATKNGCHGQMAKNGDELRRCVLSEEENAQVSRSHLVDFNVLAFWKLAFYGSHFNPLRSIIEAR